MRLLIVSHTPHFRRAGQIAGWSATVREIDQLTRLFDSVCHIAPVHAGDAAESARPYGSKAVRVREVQPAGGSTFRDKVSVLARSGEYASALREELRTADVVHVRCPAAISFGALVVLKAAGWKDPLWIKYAGSWNGYTGEPASYAAQRFWLRSGWKNAVVTVNGRSESQPSNVRSFYNPCLTEEELANAAMRSAGKRCELPVRLMFIGRLDEQKGAPVVLDIVRLLLDRGIPVIAEMVGDGPERSTLEAIAHANVVAGAVRFHGWLQRAEADRLYEMAHFVVLPSKTEGWPKVLSEGMSFGAVPLATAVGSIAEYLATFRTGRAMQERTASVFADCVADYVSRPDQWAAESNNARENASLFSYEAYLENVRDALRLPQSIHPYHGTGRLVSQP